LSVTRHACENTVDPRGLPDHLVSSRPQQAHHISCHIASLDHRGHGTNASGRSGYLPHSGIEYMFLLMSFYRATSTNVEGIDMDGRRTVSPRASTPERWQTAL